MAPILESLFVDLRDSRLHLWLAPFYSPQPALCLVKNRTRRLKDDWFICLGRISLHLEICLVTVYGSIFHAFFRTAAWLDVGHATLFIGRDHRHGTVVAADRIDVNYL